MGACCCVCAYSGLRWVKAGERGVASGPRMTRSFSISMASATSKKLRMRRKPCRSIGVRRPSWEFAATAEDNRTPWAAVELVGEVRNLKFKISDFKWGRGRMELKFGRRLGIAWPSGNLE